LKWPTVKHDGEEYQIIQEADICWIDSQHAWRLSLWPMYATN
jgi:hypothetical protein